MSISANEFVQENGNDSDSETISDDGHEQDYYQPISPIDDDLDDDDDENILQVVDDSYENPNFEINGVMGNGINNLDLNEDDDEEAEEEERIVEGLDSEISRAYREDENRRNAPLSEENSSRIMNAMRGISLQGGFAPDWISHVPEDRWIDQLRRLRQPPSSTTTTTPN